MILGGGQTTHYLLEMLESSGANVKVIEKDHEVCTDYANEFDYATIINASPSDKDVLREEGIERAEAFVSLLDKICYFGNYYVGSYMYNIMLYTYRD